MTDRARKITELQGITNVAMTDKVIVAANTVEDGWSTRNIDIGVFARNISSKLLNLPGSNTYQGSVTFASNGNANVTFLSLPANTNFGHIDLAAKDPLTSDYSLATINVVNDGVSNVVVDTFLINIGDNKIDVTGNIVSNVVTLFFSRANASTTPVTLSYSVTVL